jgi:hypothetical protein
MQQATGHVVVAGETHALGEVEQGKIDFLHKPKQWTIFSAAATQASNTKGTNSGLVLQARSYLKTTPLTGSVFHPEGKFRRSSLSSVHVATAVSIGPSLILIFGIYARHGLDSDEAAEIWSYLVQVTRGGSIPFVAIGDFNATKQELIDEGWPASLQAWVAAPGAVTAVSREIDMALLSNSLSASYLGLQANQAFRGVFAPHAAIRLGLSRAKQDLVQWVPRVPRPLPTPLRSWVQSAGQEWDKFFARGLSPTRGITSWGECYFQALATEQISFP